jgi:hypothetical protein
MIFFQKVQCLLQYLLGSERIRVNVKMSMLPGVHEAALLFVVLAFLPAQLAAGSADREGCIQKDQDIGVGDLLPHRLDVRMLLGDVATGIALLFEPADQRGFT